MTVYVAYNTDNSYEYDYDFYMCYLRDGRYIKWE